MIEWRLLLHRLINCQNLRIRIRPPLAIRISFLVVHAFSNHSSFDVHAPRIGVPTRGDEEGEMHEQDDEAYSGAHGDDDAFAGEGAVVRFFLGCAAAAYGAVWIYEVGGAVVVAFCN